MAELPPPKGKRPRFTAMLRLHRPMVRGDAFTLVELIISIAILTTITAIAVPAYHDYYYLAQVTRAIAEIRTMEREISRYESENDKFPESLADINRGTFQDPWKNRYRYLNIADVIKGKNKGKGAQKGGGHPQGARKDKHEVPLNDDYDLYSVGRDGETATPLQNPKSHDDVVRANNGEYVGLASEY